MVRSAVVISAARLQRFADARGLQFALEPAGRRTPAEFRRYDERVLVGWFGVPGATGFEVGQIVQIVALGGADNSAHTSRITWTSFTLRTGPAGNDVALRTAAAVMPTGWHADIDNNELVLWTLRRTRLTSARLWAWLDLAHTTLEPMLARPERVSDSSGRCRRGIRLAIEA